MLKLTFVGDIMCEREMLNASRRSNGEYDFSSMFSEIKFEFQNSDFVFGNLETPISFNNEDLTSAQYCFNSPLQFAEAVKESGIGFVSTANNHCLDRGINGIASTVKSLNHVKLLHSGVGEDNCKPCIIELNGIRLGVLSYTYGTNAFFNHCYLDRKHRNWVNLFQNQELSNPFTRYCLANRQKFLPRIYNKFVRTFTPRQWTCPVYERREFSWYRMRCLKSALKSLKNQKPDYILMFMHIGGQYNTSPLEYTRSMTDFLLDQGVNIVVGTHEHVVHGGVFDKIIQRKAATYSLGNFISGAGVTNPPFDKMAQYSIAWNVYLSKTEINRSTFSILKTVSTTDGMVKVVPSVKLFEHTADEKVRDELQNDILQIASVFSGNKQKAVMSEYEL